MSKRRHKYEETIRGVRYRAFTTRTEIEVLIGDGEIDDPTANVWCYPKQCGLGGACHLASVEAGRE